MAITTIQTPQLYSPSNNPIIFNFQSSSVLYFNYFLVTILASDNSVIATQRYYALPSYVNGSVFDLSTILQNYVNYQLVNSANILEPVPNILLTYHLQVQEFINETVSSGSIVLLTGKVVLSSTINTSAFNVWNGELKRTVMPTYNYLNYVSTTTTTSFLTNKPLVMNVYKDSTEYLYALNNTAVNQLQIKFYGSGQKLLGTQAIQLSGSTSPAVRFDVSPVTFSNYFGSTFNNLYGDQFQTPFTVPFGEYASVLQANYYTVQLTSQNGSARSEVRTFVLKDVKCINHFQLLFSSPLGGFDSLMLFNPRETVNSTKTSFTNYPYSINSSGQYTNINNTVYNDTNTVISSNNVYTYKAVTDVLNDSQANWLRNIITANKVYVVLSDDTYLPVTLTTTSYDVKQKRLNSTNNVLELEFTSDVAGLFD